MTMTDNRVVQTRTMLRKLDLFEYQGELFYGTYEDDGKTKVSLERTFEGTPLQETIPLVWLSGRDFKQRLVPGWYPRITKFQNGDAIVHHGMNSVYVTSKGDTRRLHHDYALALIESNDGDGKMLKEFQEKGEA